VSAPRTFAARAFGLGLAFGLVFGTAATASADRLRVDGVAAVVGAAAPREGAILILASDVELEAWLLRARDDDFDERAAAPSGAELEAARERLIGRALLVFEAHRLRLDRVDEERRSAEWRRFFEGHGGARAVDAIVTRLRLGPGELDAYVEAEVIARSFIAASSEQGGIVTDAELEMSWEEGDHPFVGMDLETVREAYRALLLERRLAAETARWIELVRARVIVRRTRR
jgi:hypothetical protein